MIWCKVEYSDDVVLVGALRRGDEAAFAWLLDQYHPQLRRTALTFVSTAASADEIVQETWLAVIRGVDGFEQRSSLKTWIYRILMNIARTRGVREQPTVPFSSAEPDTESFEPSFAADRFVPEGRSGARHWSSPPESWDEQPNDRLLATETLRRVQDAVAGLPDRQRTVIARRDLDGLSAVEVCDLLQLTEANQRVLLHRARARVRQVLEDYFAEADA